jgi:fibrillarin-like pre-rRNA processing protein
MAKKIKRHPKFFGIFSVAGRDKVHIYTLNLDKGKTIYGEKLFEEDNIEYREWNPFRSKLAAAIQNNARNTYIEKNSRVLYLGASSGTTVSHVSDIITNGIVYAVEFSPRSLRELVQNCVDRPNIIPILGDANHPYEYSKFIMGAIDVIYMDVAQPNQSEILIKNAQAFLKLGGHIIYAIKSRSIDTAESPTEIYKEELIQLEKAGFEITDKLSISPFSADHLVVFAKYHPN